jgi:hypothetical protein
MIQLASSAGIVEYRLFWNVQNAKPSMQLMISFVELADLF